MDIGYTKANVKGIKEHLDYDSLAQDLNVEEYRAIMIVNDALHFAVSDYAGFLHDYLNGDDLDSGHNISLLDTLELDVNPGLPVSQDAVYNLFESIMWSLQESDTGPRHTRGMSHFELKERLRDVYLHSVLAAVKDLLAEHIVQSAREYTGKEVDEDDLMVVE